MALWSPRMGQKGSSFGSVSSPHRHHRHQRLSPQHGSRSWHHSILGMEDQNVLFDDGAILASLESMDNNTSHLVYHYSSQVFSALSPGPKSDRISSEKTESVSTMPDIPIKDSKAKRKIYDMAFETLKCKYFCHLFSLKTCSHRLCY